MDHFTVNIFPCLVLTFLPRQVKVHAPVPCYGPYIQGQKDFRKLVLEEIEAGKEIVYLDPKKHFSKGCSYGVKVHDGRSWKINIGLNQSHIYEIIDRFSHGINFRHVLILMSVLVQENKEELQSLNNDMIVHTLFILASKKIHKLNTKGTWLMNLLIVLCEGLRNKFLPSFYFPRQNLLNIYGVSENERQRVLNKLGFFVTDLKADPKCLYKYTGCIDESERGSERGLVSSSVSGAQDGETENFEAPDRQILSNHGQAVPDGKILSHHIEAPDGETVSHYSDMPDGETLSHHIEATEGEILSNHSEATDGEILSHRSEERWEDRQDGRSLSTVTSYGTDITQLVS